MNAMPIPVNVETSHGVNRRPRLTPPNVGRSIGWSADRRSDPTPIDSHGLEMPEDTAARAVLPDPSCVIEPLRHLDLHAAAIGTVVWATGYDYDFGWIVVPVLNTRGEPVHSQGITDVPGMYFLGLRWLTSFKSSLLSGIGEDAARLADHIAARTC